MAARDGNRFDPGNPVGYLDAADIVSLRMPLEALRRANPVALRRAAAAGIVGAFTSNDDENGPMLAVNNWLGYRRGETQTGLLRTL